MLDLLSMPDRARDFHTRSSLRALREDHDISFSAIIQDVVKVRRLREMSRAIGVSHSHLSALGTRTRLEPSYSAGVKIIRWYRENILSA